MTLLATIVSVAVVVALVLLETEKYVNIIEALVSGVEKSDILRKQPSKKENWKKAYV